MVTTEGVHEVTLEVDDDAAVGEGGAASPIGTVVGEAAERLVGPCDLVVPDVSDWPTGREVVHRAVARSVVQLIVHLHVARAGEDTEGVHQARVAIRRLRSDLGTFGVMVDPFWVAGLQPELRWLGAEFGVVRNDDVLIETVSALGAPDSLVRAFDVERAAHRASLLAALDDRRTRRLLEGLIVAAHDPPTAPQADDPADELLRPKVRKRWGELRRAVSQLGRSPMDADLHRVRILTKRCRYAVEAAAPAFGPGSLAWAKRLAAVQDALGALNDAAIIIPRLGDMADLVAAEAFAAGQVAGRLEERSEAGRIGWRTVWDEATDKAQLSWL